MTNMIPKRLPENTNDSERKIFDLIRNAPGTQGYTAIHSLELKRRWGKYLIGEIDFVVVIPRYGILCLEVKGGNQNEYYVYMGRTNPIDQARKELEGLRKKIASEFDSDLPHSKCAMGYAVVFTDRECPDYIEETERWRVIGKRDVDNKNLLRRIIEIMERDREINRDVQIAEIKRRSFELTASQAKEIVKFLRPDFELVPGFGLSDLEQDLLRLTEEQYDRLDELEGNPRCLFLGAAGTGKTVLAAEYARRMASDGKKTLFVCFNLLLSDELKEMTREYDDVASGAFYEVLEDIILNSSLANDFAKEKRTLLDSGKTVEFYDHVYLRYLEKSLSEYEQEDLFDVLVIDEFHDFLREDVDIVGVLGKALRGGWANGSWAIFGDSNQALYGPSVDPADILRDYCGHTNFVRARLRVNCRNTRNIAEATSKVTGFKSLLPRRPVDGPPVIVHPCNTNGDYLDNLTNLVNQLIQEGIDVKDITLLSLHRMENSVLSETSSIAGIPLVYISESRRRGLDIDAHGSLKFSTIRAFKGLESPVVIIVGVDDLAEKALTELYVGMSRAKTLLALMVKEDIYEEVENLISA